MKPDATYKHGTALDVHCCNCHSGFIFDANHACPEEAIMEGQVLKFKITFKRGPEVVAIIVGCERPLEALAVGDVAERVIETEQYLERITGLRVHIETAD